MGRPFEQIREKKPPRRTARPRRRCSVSRLLGAGRCGDGGLFADGEEDPDSGAGVGGCGQGRGMSDSGGEVLRAGLGWIGGL